MAGTLVISTLGVAFHVLLKRLEDPVPRGRAGRMDRYSTWVYPLAYAVGAFLAGLLFLR